MRLLAALACAARKRKRSVPIPWTPLNLSGLVAWYDFSDLDTLFQNDDFTSPVTANGQNVRSVRDKSGNNHDLTKVLVGATPHDVTYVANWKNGLGAITGAGSDTNSYCFLEASHSETIQEFFSSLSFETAEALYYKNRLLLLTTTPGSVELMQQVTNGTDIYPWIDGFSQTGSWSPALPDAVIGTPSVWTIKLPYAATGAINFMDGTRSDKSTATTTLPATNKICVAGKEGYFTGKQGEVVIGNSITEAELILLDAYMRGRWG